MQLSRLNTQSLAAPAIRFSSVKTQHAGFALKVQDDTFTRTAPPQIYFGATTGEQSSFDAKAAYEKIQATLPNELIGQEAVVLQFLKDIVAVYAEKDLSAPTPPVVGLIDGPAGTGKNLLVQKLAKSTGRPLVYLNAAELSSDQDVRKLKGAQVGSIGYGDPTSLEVAILKAKEEGTPPPILFVDEIEKASPVVRAELEKIVTSGRLRGVDWEKIGAGGLSTAITDAHEAGSIPPDVTLQGVDVLMTRSNSAPQDLFSEDFEKLINVKATTRPFSQSDLGKLLDQKLELLTSRAQQQIGYALRIDDSFRQHCLQNVNSADAVRSLSRAMLDISQPLIDFQIAQFSVPDSEQPKTIVAKVNDGKVVIEAASDKA